MELSPGLYHFDDLTPGNWFATRWITAEPESVGAFASLTGWPGKNPFTLPEMLVLSLVEGAKQSGPVQIAAQMIRSWQITPGIPCSPANRFRGRYEVLNTRLSGKTQLLTLSLQIESDFADTILNAEAKLIAENRISDRN